MVVAAYRRREPEKGVMHQVIRENLATFVERAEQRGRGLPKYVRKGFASFLDCGDVRKGFARVHCPGCGQDAVVAFS